MQGNGGWGRPKASSQMHLAEDAQARDSAPEGPRCPALLPEEPRGPEAELFLSWGRR